MSRSNRGMTYTEVMVAALVLGMLYTAALAIYRMGVNSWMKADDRTTLLSNLQLASRQLTSESQRTHYPTISVTPDGKAFAFLEVAEVPQVDNAGRPFWDHFVVFYYDGTEKTLVRKEVPYAPPDPTMPDTIDSYTGASLSSHLSGGRPVVRHLADFHVQSINPDILEFRLKTEVEANAHAGTESMQLEVTVQVTN